MTANSIKEGINDVLARIHGEDDVEIFSDAIDKPAVRSLIRILRHSLICEDKREGKYDGEGETSRVAAEWQLRMRVSYSSSMNNPGMWPEERSVFIRSRKPDLSVNEMMRTGRKRDPKTLDSSKMKQIFSLSTPDLVNTCNNGRQKMRNESGKEKKRRRKRRNTCLRSVSKSSEE